MNLVRTLRVLLLFNLVVMISSVIGIAVAWEGRAAAVLGEAGSDHRGTLGGRRHV